MYLFNMDYFYLFWAVCGIALGVLYTFSLQREIVYSQKNKQNISRINLPFSILRIVSCSAVLIIGLYQKIQYGLVCLIVFFIFKYLSLFFFLKKNNKVG